MVVALQKIIKIASNDFDPKVVCNTETETGVKRIDWDRDKAQWGGTERSQVG